MLHNVYVKLVKDQVLIAWNLNTKIRPGKMAVSHLNRLQLFQSLSTITTIQHEFGLFQTFLMLKGNASTGVHELITNNIR